MRALKNLVRMRTVVGTVALVFALSLWCAAQYGYPQSNYPQSNRSYGQYGQSNQLTATQAPVLEYADPHTITIMWRTNMDANSVVRFGTSPDNVGNDPGQVVQLNDDTRVHRVEMRNRFQPGTTYYFQLISDRGNGDSIVSPMFSVQTPPQGSEPIRDQQLMAANNSGYGNGNRDRDNDDNDNYNRSGSNRNGDRYANNNNGWRHRRGDEYAENRNGEYGRNQNNGYGQQMPQGDQPGGNIQITRPPMLQTLGDSIAVITWRTNAPASAVVHYGTDPNNLSQTAQAPWGETLHTVTIQNLQPGTHYFFNVSSGQAQGTGTTTNSDTLSFTTQPQGARPLERVRPTTGQ